MRVSTIFLVTTSIVGIHAQDDIDLDDYQDLIRQCLEPCGGLLQSSLSCYSQNQDNEAAYTRCLCNSQDISSLLPNCEACISAYDEPDNEFRELVSACSLTPVSTFTTPSSASVTGTSTSSNGPNSNTAQTTTSTTTSTPSVTLSPTGGSFEDNNNNNNNNNNNDDDDDDDDDNDGGNSGSNMGGGGSSASGFVVPGMGALAVAILVAAVAL